MFGERDIGQQKDIENSKLRAEEGLSLQAEKTHSEWASPTGGLMFSSEGGGCCALYTCRGPQKAPGKIETKRYIYFGIKYL